MARPPKFQPPPPEPKQEYFVLDPHAEDIGGVDVPVDQNTGERLKTIRMTASQAAFGLANGSISVEDPEKNKPAQQAIARNLGDDPFEGDKDKKAAKK